MSHVFVCEITACLLTQMDMEQHGVPMYEEAARLFVIESVITECASAPDCTITAGQQIQQWLRGILTDSACGKYAQIG